MKRLNISVFFLACLLLLVFQDSVPEQNFHRGPEYSHANFVKHPRVFLNVSPIAIQRVLDALYSARLSASATSAAFPLTSKRNQMQTTTWDVVCLPLTSSVHRIY